MGESETCMQGGSRADTVQSFPANAHLPVVETTLCMCRRAATASATTAAAAGGVGSSKTLKSRAPGYADMQSPVQRQRIGRNGEQI